MAAFAVVQNRTHAIDEPPRIRICDTFGSRLRGLMFRPSLGRNEGLLLVGTHDGRWDAAIHMLMVPFDLAVVWINSGMEVVDRVLARAWHMAYVPARPARYVLELHPDRYAAYDIGNVVEIIDA